MYANFSAEIIGPILRTFSLNSCKHPSDPASCSAFFSRPCWAPNYGIYGPAFEQFVNEPVRPGSEEYLHSEKYEIRYWDLKKKESLAEFIALVNRIRRENPALQNDHSLRFHAVTNDQLLCFSKQSADGTNVVLVVINLDPHHTHSGFVELP